MDIPIEQCCVDRNVLVVGSGPNYDRDLCSQQASDSVSIVANQAAQLYHSATKREADVLCTTAHLYKQSLKDRNEFEIRQSLVARRFESIWLDTKNASFDEASWFLDQDLVHANKLNNCAPWTRASIVFNACGADLWVSTGVFAVCLALHSRATIVRTNGISLANGHAVGDDQPRMHVNEDRQCLQRLLDLHPDRLTLQDNLVNKL